MSGEGPGCPSRKRFPFNGLRAVDPTIRGDDGFVCVSLGGSVLYRDCPPGTRVGTFLPTGTVELTTGEL